MGELFIQLVILGVFGAVVAVLAQSRGRSAVGWFFVGFFFPCIGLILVLVLPDLKRDQAMRERLRTENRRLRERVRMDRQVADQRHAATVKRLGAHDAVLGVDTAVEDERPPELPAGARGSDLDPEIRWHYAATEDSGSEGPVQLATLRELWAAGTLGPESLVWAKGMDDWVPISDHPALHQELQRG
ncbi:MAG: DUF4339 domain-containing protein [Planctomycetota bacterium]